MATEKKTTENVVEKKKTTAPVTEEKMVTIKLPLTRTEKDDVYVALNGKPYLIKRGEEVKVPAGVAEILQHKEEMLSIAIEFESEASSHML